MVYIYSLLVALFIIAVTLFLIIRVSYKNEHSLVLKTIASLIFVAIGLLSIIKGNDIRLKAMFTFGLVCGLVGDILLDLKVMYKQQEKVYLNCGMLVFGMGHIAYFFGLLIYISDKVLTGYGWVLLSAFCLSLLIGALIVRFAPKLKLDMAGYKWQNFLYSSVLVFMTLSSVCLAIVVSYVWIMAIGFILFLASDLVLSMQYFGGKADSKGLTIANHVLYYVAQLLLATFVFFI